MKTAVGLHRVANGLLRQRTVAVMNYLLLGSVHILLHHENGLYEPSTPVVINRLQGTTLPLSPMTSFFLLNQKKISLALLAKIASIECVP